MLEWKMIKLQDKSFIGMRISLPKQSMHMISSTKCTLLGNYFNLVKLTPNSCFFMMEKSDGYRSLLYSRVVDMNGKAKQEGYQIGMSGKEVLLYGTIKKTEEKI